MSHILHLLMKVSQLVLILILFLILLYFVEQQLKVKRHAVNFVTIDQRQYINLGSENDVSEETPFIDGTLEFRKLLTELIKSDRIEDAIGELSRYTETNEQHHQNAVVHLSSRWQNLVKRDCEGRLSSSEFFVERNRLIYSLLELTRICF